MFGRNAARNLQMLLCLFNRLSKTSYASNVTVFGLREQQRRFHFFKLNSNNCVSNNLIYAIIFLFLFQLLNSLESIFTHLKTSSKKKTLENSACEEDKLTSLNPGVTLPKRLINSII